MTSNPTIWEELTVVLLACDREDLATLALASLERQHIKPGRIIVSDDSSSDEVRNLTLGINGLNVDYRRGPRNGQSANLRSAIALVTTDFLMVLHDDDLLDEHFIQVAHQHRNERFDVFLSGLRYISFSGAELPHLTAARSQQRGKHLAEGRNELKNPLGAVRPLLISQVLSPFQGTVFNRTALNGWLADSSRGDLDDYWISVHLAQAPVVLIYDARLLCDYRVHADSVANRGGKYATETVAILREVAEISQFSEFRPELRKKARAKAVDWAYAEILYGSFESAKRMLAEAFRVPKSLRELVLWTALRSPLKHLLRYRVTRRSAKTIR